MSDTKQEFIKIIHTKEHKKFSAKLNSIDLMDGDFYINYIPSLKLSSYGSNAEEAIRMMTEVVIPDFCETLMDQNKEKVLNDLRGFGWTQSPFFKAELCKSAHIDKEGILKDFDLSENTELKERVLSI
jgi:hypothetical protein